MDACFLDYFPRLPPATASYRGSEDPEGWDFRGDRGANEDGLRHGGDGSEWMLDKETD